MRCDEVRQFLWPYLDSELDDRTTFLVGRHLEDCRECAVVFAREEALERAVAERLRAANGDEAAVLGRAVAGALGPGGRSRARIAACAAAAVVLVAAVAAVFLRGGDELPDLVAVAAADHRKFAEGRMGPEVDASSIGGYFRERLGIDAAVEPAARWTVDGGRLCRLRSARVALVMFRYEGAPVSLFLVPGEEADKFPRAREVAPRGPRYRVPGGHGVVALGGDGTLRCAVGDVEPEALEGLLARAR